MAFAKAQSFSLLHRGERPLLLYNIWDAGGAIALEKAGASAIATSSWAMASANGYRDGEELPFELLLSAVKRIAECVEVPVTVDIESGYAQKPEDLASNMSRLIKTGLAGVNFEDRVIGGRGLYPLDQQSNRISGLRSAANAAGTPVFLNARTDIFFMGQDASTHAEFVEEAIIRCKAYLAAGADGVFLPGLAAPEIISEICRQVTAPINLMLPGQVCSIAELGDLGVARISCGPGPYLAHQDCLTEGYGNFASPDLV